MNDKINLRKRYNNLQGFFSLENGRGANKATDMGLEFIVVNLMRPQLADQCHILSINSCREMLAYLHAESEIFFQVRKNRYNALNRRSLKASNGTLKEVRGLFI